MLDFIYYPVSWILWFWHKVFGFVFGESSGISWVLGIIFLVWSLRAILFKPFVNQVRSMRKMQQIQPQVKAIQDRYAKLKMTDPARQKMNTELMELYKAKGANPASGCLPMVLTFPVLFAFYAFLSQAIELRGAPWIFWIHDLSRHDPYYVTPLHHQPALRFLGYEEGSLPETERAARENFSIPLWPGIPPDTQELVVDAVKSAAAAKITS